MQTMLNLAALLFISMFLLAPSQAVKCPRSGLLCPHQCCYDKDDNELCCDQRRQYYGAGGPPLIDTSFSWAWLLIGLAVSIIVSVVLSVLCCILCNCAAWRPFTLVRGVAGSDSEDGGGQQLSFWGGTGRTSATIYIHGSQPPADRYYHSQPPPKYHDSYRYSGAPYSSMDAREYQRSSAIYGQNAGRSPLHVNTNSSPSRSQVTTLNYLDTGGSRGDVSGTWPKADQHYSGRGLTVDNGRISPASSVKSVRFADEHSDGEAITKPSSLFVHRRLFLSSLFSNIMVARCSQ